MENNSMKTYTVDYFYAKTYGEFNIEHMTFKAHSKNDAHERLENPFEFPDLIFDYDSIKEINKVNRDGTIQRAN